MPQISPDVAYLVEAKHWRMVLGAMTEVFGLEREDATARVRELRTRMADASPSERLLELHLEPLHVAADALGMECDDEKVEAYLAMAEREGWHGGADKGMAA